MRYIGGKSKIGKKIAKFINKLKPKRYIEPLVGMCGVIKHVVAEERYGYDIQPKLIQMWKDVQSGIWKNDLPEDMTEEFYKQLKIAAECYSASLYNIAAYGCSFGGKFFDGFARSKGRNYYKEAIRSLEKDAPLIHNIHFDVKDYREIKIEESDLVYCDPPYFETTKVGNSNSFNHDEFWNWCNNQKCKMIVSEFTGPKDWNHIVLVERFSDLSSGINGKGNKRIEKLFFNY